MRRTEHQSCDCGADELTMNHAANDCDVRCSSWQLYDTNLTSKAY